MSPVGAIMVRWRPLTSITLTYFDDCEFGKYWFISFRFALLMRLKPSHICWFEFRSRRRGSKQFGITSLVGALICTVPDTRACAYAADQ